MFSRMSGSLTTSENGAVRIAETESGLKTETFQDFQLKKTKSDERKNSLNYKKLFACGKGKNIPVVHI